MLALSGCVPTSALSKTSSTAPFTLPDGVIAIGARELFDYYADDEKAADARFKGKILEVTGTVSTSRSRFGNYYAIFGSLSFIRMWGVQCQFSDTSDPRLAKLKRGDRATIRGRLEEFKLEVILKDSQLIKVEKK